MLIHEIELSWFRGAASQVSLRADGRSLVVYGPNGSGKSSFVDGIEYICAGGRIRHLSHEYSGRRLEKAVINTLASKDNGPSIKIQLSSSTAAAAISHDGSVELSGREELGHWDARRMILRQDEVADFIHSSKSEKYNSILQLLGLSHLDSAAVNVRAIGRKVQDLAKLKEKEGQVQLLRQRLGCAFSPADPSRAKERLRDLHIKHFDDEPLPPSLNAVVRKLRPAIEEEVGNLDTRRTAYLHAKSAYDIELSELHSNAVRAAQEAASVAERLVAERLAVLNASKQFALNSDTEEQIPCPACGQRLPKSQFQSHVEAELERLTIAQATYNQRRTCFRALADGISRAVSLLSQEVVCKELIQAASEPVRQSLEHLRGYNRAALESETASPDLAWLAEVIEPLSLWLGSIHLDLPPTTQELVAERDLLDKASDFIQLTRLEKEIGRVRPIVDHLAVLEREIRQEIASVSKTLVAELSSEIQAMWAILHPGEPVEDIQLIFYEDGAKGLDIALRFHGKEQLSPRMTLSEGHRNSLGLAVFLSFAKRSNAATCPLVLDDVVTSFDREHRCFVADLLMQEFSEHQVLIFTHDDQWFTELQHRLPRNRWKFATLLPWREPLLGIQVDSRGQGFAAARALLEVDSSTAANKARALMDVHMGIIAERLAIPVPYVRGARNDLRNALDLLLRFQSRAKEKMRRRLEDEASHARCDSTIAKAASASELLVPWANAGSHGRYVTRVEAERLIDACENVISAVSCERCETSIWHAEVAQKHLRCSCDQIRWLN